MTFVRAAKCWQTSLFSKFVFEDIFLRICFGLPRPLRTAFELQNYTAYTKNQPDATALTENATNWLKRSKNIKITFRFFQIFKKGINGKSGGLCERKLLGTSLFSFDVEFL